MWKIAREKSELISQLNELRDRKDASGRPLVPPELEIETSWRDIVSEERVLSKRATDQQEAIWEFITTELTYIQHMTLFSTLYSWFCELQQHGFLRDIAAHRVFLNAPELHAVNLELWRRSIWPMLEEARQQGAPLDPTRLSGGLADITFWSRCYIDFNIHQSDARQYVLRKCKEHELFREFVTWCEGLEEMQRHRHKLHDMLAYPFQRLTRYYLLLRAILKLSADHDEKALLQTLTDRAEASVAQLNAEMNNNELRLALAELMRQLDTYEPVDSDEFDRLFPGKRCVLNLTAPMPYLPGPPRFRRVLTRGDLKMRETRTGAKQELHAILLSDMLLLCRPTGRRPAGASADRLRVVRPPLHVSNLSFYPFPDLGGFYLLALNEFDVPSCLLMLWTSSSDETRKWLEILTMAVDEWQREFRRLSENGGSQSVDGEEFLYGNALPPPSMFGIPPGPGSAATTTATTTTMAAGGENGLFHRKSSSVDGQVAAVLQGHYANHHYGPPPPPPQHARYLHHYIGGGGGGGGAPVHHHQYITRDHHPIRKASMGASMCGATSTEQLLGRAESARSLVNANAASIRHMHKQSVCSMDCAISTEHLLGVGSTLLPQSKSSVDLAQPHPQHQHHSSTGSLVDQQQQQQQQQQQLQRPPPMHANSVESATHSRQTSIDLVPAPTTAPNAHLLHCVPQDDVACTSETNNNGGGGMCGPNSANSRRFERRYHTSDGIEVVRCAPPSSSTSLSSNGPTSILKRFSWNVSSGAGASSRKIHSRLHEQNRRQSTSTASASSESFSSSTSGVSSTSSQSTDGAEPTSECTATAVVDAHVSTVAVPPTANATLHEEDEREDVSTSSLVPPAVPSTLPPRSPDSSGTTSPSSSASSLSVDQQQQQQQQQQHQQQQHQEHQKQQHHQQEQRARLLRMIIDDALETSEV